MKGLILVTGSDGLVGSRFVELSPRKNFLHLPKEVEMDITRPDEMKEMFTKYNFSAVVHFAAYTNVNKAEDQRDDKFGSCWQVNVDGTRNLLDAHNPNKTHFIHISTDMVFSGNEVDKGPYPETHKPEIDVSKLTWYGFTKTEAERNVLEKLGDRATVLRFINPVRATFTSKLDYLRKPLKLYDEKKLYPLFADQQISITCIDEAVETIEKIINTGKRGVFHSSSIDTTTPHKLISYMLKKVRNNEKVVKSVKLQDYLTKGGQPSVRYPQYGGLKVDDTQMELDISYSSWREIVDKLAKQGISYE